MTSKDSKKVYISITSRDNEREAKDEKKLCSAIELLNRYSIIRLRKEIVNIHSLVQKVAIRMRYKRKIKKGGKILMIIIKLINYNIIQCEVYYTCLVVCR